MSGKEAQGHAALRAAWHASMAMAGITVVTFGLALLAVPIAGSNCPSNCIEYPYLDTLDRFPRDYVWMFVAVGLITTYLIFIVSLRAVAGKGKSIAGQVAVALAILVAAVLIPTYFVQFSVVPSSLSAGQTDGIPLLTQYNPHGVFIALEEVGYLLMSLSFLAAVPLIEGEGGMSRVVRWVFSAGFIIPFVAFIAVAAAYGFDRQDRFEVIVISVDWLVLIANGILLSLIFRRRLHTATTP